MAVLDGAELYTYTYPVTSQELDKLSDNLHAYTVDYWPPYGSDDLHYVFQHTEAVGKNLPVETVTYSISMGQVYESYFADFYNRIHVIPKSLDLGNITSLQTTQVEVWNAYLVPNSLTSIQILNLDGVTFTNASGLNTYAALESRFYTLTALADGQSIINGNVRLNFGTGSVSIPITGQRGFIFPFAPLTSYKETINWTSNVIQTISSEQVLALKDIPKQTLTYNYRFRTVNEFTLAKNIAKKYQHLTLVSPIWAQTVRIGAVALNATTINVKTDFMEISVGDLAVVYQNYLLYEVVEITAKTSTSVTIKQGITTTFTGNLCFIPAKICYTPKGFDFNRSSSSVNSLSVTFENTKGFTLSSISGYSTYLSLPIIETITPIESSITENFEREVEYINNDLGDLEPVSLVNYTKDRKVLNLFSHGQANIYKMKRLLDYFKGKKNYFYLPTFSADGEPVVTSLPISSTSIDIKYAGFSLTAPSLIRIIADVNTIVQVANVTKSISTETITFSSPIAAALTGIKSIQILTKCRCDTDNFSIDYDYSKHEYITAKVSIPVLEVK